MEPIALEDLTLAAQSYITDNVQSDSYYVWFKRKEDLRREEFKVPKQEWEEGFNAVIEIFRQQTNFEGSEVEKLFMSRRTYTIKLDERQSELREHMKNLRELRLGLDEYRKTVSYIRQRMKLE